MDRGDRHTDSGFFCPSASGALSITCGRRCALNTSLRRELSRYPAREGLLGTFKRAGARGQAPIGSEGRPGLPGCSEKAQESNNNTLAGIRRVLPLAMSDPSQIQMPPFSVYLASLQWVDYLLSTAQPNTGSHPPHHLEGSKG